MRRHPSSSGAGPMIVLVIGALVPALLLWWVASWAGGKVDAAEDAVPESVDTVAPPTAAPPALSTGLLSLRRTASTLSNDLNFAAFQSSTTPLLDMVNGQSCAMVSLNGVVVGARNELVPIIPASNQKVLVAAVALDVLGPEFVFTTDLVGPAPSGGVINGDVFLVGGGDALLSGEWYEEAALDANPAFNTTPIDELARQLIAAGVTEVRGAIRGDGSRYDDEWYVDSWGEGVAGLEAGPYDALLVNDSRVRGAEQRSSDPVLAGATEFVRILGEQGITVSGGAAVGTAPAGAGVLASVNSQPLPAVLEEMLTNSDNNTAEMMVKEIGLAAGGAGTRQAGLDAMAANIAEWGVDTTGLVLADGSGLSLDNRVTCTTLIGVLQHAGSDSAVAAGLAIAGQTGTLASVFTETPVAGRLLGKTGTLNNFPIDADPPAVKTLAGYLPVEGGGSIEFALLLNGPTISDQSEYRPLWAQLATTLDSFPAVASPAALGPR
ncbi:MAG TPA: D-alanyl-D-alanine carboxypeptidase/D-alanyl-D-alanine-endopeptidase [Ilumatobacter sp.]|nr:D-alanyl-D-alanine carboxypeptidase/D-alanyl-D-alanine-endopeptidase [Ilumatobacter sp.]